MAMYGTERSSIMLRYSNPHVPTITSYEIQHYNNDAEGKYVLENWGQIPK